MVGPLPQIQVVKMGCEGFEQRMNGRSFEGDQALGCQPLNFKTVVHQLFHQRRRCFGVLHGSECFCRFPPNSLFLAVKRLDQIRNGGLSRFGRATPSSCLGV